jgi:hypothetical protein
MELVLGIAGGLSEAETLPFVRSLRATGFAGEVILFLHRAPAGLATALRRAGAEPVELELDGVPDPLSYNLIRYRLFAAHLRSLREPTRVLLSDVRDVLFQRDPFRAIADDDGLHLFLEHEAKPIGACIWTSSWIRFRYGDDALPPLAGRPVICSGIVLGRTPALLRYVERVAAEIDPALRATHYMAGYDQGIVNRLCHGPVPEDLSALVLHPYRSSPVLHLGNAPPGTVRLDGAGELRNDDGEVVAIVHQYDRHPELASLATRLANR